MSAPSSRTPQNPNGPVTRDLVRTPSIKTSAICIRTSNTNSSRSDPCLDPIQPSPGSVARASHRRGIVPFDTAPRTRAAAATSRRPIQPRPPADDHDYGARPPALSRYHPVHASFVFDEVMPGNNKPEITRPWNLDPPTKRDWGVSPNLSNLPQLDMLLLALCYGEFFPGLAYRTSPKPHPKCHFP